MSELGDREFRRVLVALRRLGCPVADDTHVSVDFEDEVVMAGSSQTR
jgi:hypothetical protein